jgi:AraC-like DNA-binding protein
MLLARGSTTIGKGRIAWACTFAGRIWSVLVERDGLALDTRFVPPVEGDPKPNGCLYLLLHGTFQTFDASPVRREAPCAFIVTDEELDGGRGVRVMPLRASGAPYRAIELHLALADIVSPRGVVTLDAATWDAAMRAGQLEAHTSDEALVSPVTELLERLAAAGIIRREAVAVALKPTSPTFGRLWSALRPMVERLYLAPTIQQVSDATGVSGRQIDRYVRDFVHAFGLVGAGWRPATRHLRLKLSVILLSAEGASVGDIAKIVGYGSSDAMARAFRDAKMPAPSTIQEELRKAALEAAPA